MRLINLPTKASRARLDYNRSDLEKGFIHVQAHEGNYCCTVLEFDLGSPAGIASAVVYALEEARDLGYKQAQTDMRRALGMKE